jgi:hypothetical protein
MDGFFGRKEREERKGKERERRTEERRQERQRKGGRGGERWRQSVSGRERQRISLVAVIVSSSPSHRCGPLVAHCCWPVVVLSSLSYHPLVLIIRSVVVVSVVSPSY